jgi:hypothetical protein
LFGIPEETARLLMTIHEGAWLGRGPKVYYTLIMGCGLLALGIFGLLLRRKRHWWRGSFGSWVGL